MPRLLTLYDTGTFYNCSNLKLFVALKLHCLPQNTFSGCSLLEIVIAPNSAVEENAFINCEKLHTVLVKIGDYECTGCENCPKCFGTWE